MKTEGVATPYPALLPLGIVVGSWRVVAWQGGGVHGAVYRAVKVGQEDAAPVALKVALLPGDPRFGREVEGLGRVLHPSVPKLLDQGEWQHPGGTRHPYIVMELVEGLPLYEWARRNNPSSGQVLRWLAQVAGALSAVHAQRALHRDVKGSNILVRHADGRAVLIDFGSGTHEGAATLTSQVLPPGTPAYRSPEACLFELRHWREPQARYRAGPADDLYALGVTGYRLVTGQYPELAEPWQDEQGTWHLGRLVAPPAQAFNERVDPQLSALIHRMLAVDPEDRGTVEAMAAALERAAERGAPGLGGPVLEGQLSPVLEAPQGGLVAEPRMEIARAEVGEPTRVVPAPVRGSVESLRPRAPAQRRRALVLAAAVLVAWGGWRLCEDWLGRPPVEGREVAGLGDGEQGKAALGEGAASAVVGGSPEPAAEEAVAESEPPTPLSWQERPDANGRCPLKNQVVLNGGCWVERSCEEVKAGFVYIFQGKCYLPARARGRQPTSGTESSP